MGSFLVFPTSIPLRFSQTPRSISPRIHPNQCQAHKFTANSPFGYKKVGILNTNSSRKLCTRALISEVSNQRQYPKVGAKSTGPIPPSQLIEVVETAAKIGAEVYFFLFLLCLYIFILLFNIQFFFLIFICFYWWLWMLLTNQEISHIKD